jgi:hypothetical protein
MLHNMALMHLESRHAPPYNFIAEAQLVEVNSGEQKHEHEACKFSKAILTFFFKLIAITKWGMASTSQNSALASQV